MAKDYSETLNLPKTEFPMKSNLPVKEPDTQAYWEEMELYEKILKRNEGNPEFLLHDGPPFSNGYIHMGTSMNKVLKDFIIKSKSMSGKYTPFVPGWDNHGMPIESAIIKKNKIDRKKMAIPDFRRACQEFAENYVQIQMDQFKRLGVVGDWKHPYLTMRPEFESREIRVFGEMFKKGYIYKGLKPVYWCPKDETALAEAEIEYQTDKCTSVYVRFKLENDLGKLKDVCDLDKTYVIIWTTTTWTLTGNLAIALNPSAGYAVIKTANGEYLIVAEELSAQVMKAGGITDYEIIKTLKGAELENMEARHPFLDRKSRLINAEYVTMESGTGCVHIAPGFGADDFIACKKYDIDVLVTVNSRGVQTEDAGEFAGMYYEASATAIFDKMKEDGTLFAYEVIDHEYPHCWRCKSPIIFRATPQWFCSVESFKDKAIEACKDVNWDPSWGGERMVQMIEKRADWCISRQRYWGLPIPVFYCKDCGKPICNDETTEIISKLFAEKGSNAWYELSEKEILPESFTCPHCGGKEFIKETDTLDGWFDSGSSHFAVLEDRLGYKGACDLYLEGSDQYRGWFQSSLLTSVAASDKGAPYKNVISHGWVVDGEGKAMHKSLGNSIAPEVMINKYGADLVRLWVSSSDYRVDVRASENIFMQLAEAYRKIRNTMRMMLANLNDFNPNTDQVEDSALMNIDKWALAELNELIKTCLDAYGSYEFHVIYHEAVNFCTNTLSKRYIDIIKDRLYVEKSSSTERRSTQTVLYRTVKALTKLIAPILSYTAEEIWKYIPKQDGDNAESVFLNDMPTYTDNLFRNELESWENLFVYRDDVLKVIEMKRAEKLIGKSLDAAVTICTEDDFAYNVLNGFIAELPAVFIVSQVKVEKGKGGENAIYNDTTKISVAVSAAEGRKCDRCWNYTTDGVEDGEGYLCKRCHKIING